MRDSRIARLGLNRVFDVSDRPRTYGQNPHPTMPKPSKSRYISPMETSPPWHIAECLDLVLADGSGSPRFDTEVRLLWREAGLWLRFDCRDELRWSHFTERDAPLWQEEVVEVFIAQGASVPRRYWEIEVNPLGALFEARVHNPDGERRSMSVDMTPQCPGLRHRVGSGRERQDWWVELFLPWPGLGAVTVPRPDDTWRANFLRVERPAGRPSARDEFSCWSPTGRDPADFHVPACFGTLCLSPDVKASSTPSDSSGLPVARVPFWPT